MKHSRQAIFLFAALTVSLQPFPSVADAVSESLKNTMHECVLDISPRVGSPYDDYEKWANAVSLYTDYAFAHIKFFGIPEDSDLISGVSDKTNSALTKWLEDSGFRNFRSQLTQTIEECLPLAMISADNMFQHMETEPCPDDTNFKHTVWILHSTPMELRTKYGNFSAIPPLLQNPKVLVGYDAEVV